MWVSSPVHGASAELIGEVARRAGGVRHHCRCRLEVVTEACKASNLAP